ncbi:MAG: hypothetical protein P1S60_17270 [Anaerolineae bacterium]|nr:hypothetical protein [Anaerolineae bacterium]
MFGWNRTSYTIMRLLVMVLVLIVIVWWPLAEEQISYWNPDLPWYWQMDWLLVGDFLVMSLLIMAGADLRHDIWIAAIGLAGGLAIEGWGTQTELRQYYTLGYHHSGSSRYDLSTIWR